MSEVKNYEFDLTLDRIRRRIPDAKTILARAVVMHIGWEMDNECCAVELEDGSRILVGTSHGGVYQLDVQEDLKNLMTDYEAALSQCRSVLAALDAEPSQ